LNGSFRGDEESSHREQPPFTRRFRCSWLYFIIKMNCARLWACRWELLFQSGDNVRKFIIWISILKLSLFNEILITDLSTKREIAEWRNERKWCNIVIYILERGLGRTSWRKCERARKYKNR
jgi:hypothetical protein